MKNLVTPIRLTQTQTTVNKVPEVDVKTKMISQQQVNNCLSVSAHFHLSHLDFKSSLSNLLPEPMIGEFELFVSWRRKKVYKLNLSLDRLVCSAEANRFDWKAETMAEYHCALVKRFLINIYLPDKASTFVASQFCMQVSQISCAIDMIAIAIAKHATTLLAPILSFNFLFFLL